MPGSSNIKLSLIGICTQPELELENEGKLYFTPTFTGVYSKKSYRIENISKNNVLYKIKVPEKYQQELYFEPSEKELLPNEVFNVDAFFSPSSKRKYKIKVPV